MERGKRAKTKTWDFDAQLQSFYDSEEGEKLSIEMPSSSSSLFVNQSQHQNQNQGQGQVAVETETGQASNFNKALKSVNDLPPEMLTEIMKLVDTRSLFNCRLVNPQWCAISSGILTKRSDAKISFHFENDKFYQPRPTTITQTRGLKTFLSCMKKSKNCPFSRFSFFCDPEGWYFTYTDFFHHQDFLEFVWAGAGSITRKHKNKSNNKKQHQNPNPNQNQIQIFKIKSLEFQFNHPSQSFKMLIEHLRDLLLEELPHLEEFRLKLPNQSPGEYQDPEMKLFPVTDEHAQNPMPMVQLTNLKMLHVDDFLISKFPGVLKDLFNAAINLNKIYFYNTFSGHSTRVYKFLHSVGKFHLLKTFSVDVNDIINFSQVQMEERPDFIRDLLSLQLEELKLDKLANSNDSSSNDPNYFNFLSHLFKSNKNSLKKLSMVPLGHFNALQFPTFKTLTKLKLQQALNPLEVYFSPGVRSLDIFPHVSELDLPEWSWSSAFPHLDCTPVFPRVENLKGLDIGFTEDSIRILSLLCPNLKHLKIHRDTRSGFNVLPRLNFFLVGRQIWTHMKQLESLEVDINVDAPENCAFNLDSCFTGISPGNCYRLYKRMEAKKALEMWGFPPQSLGSEFELTAVREHPSILHMTNLRTLIINPYSRTNIMDCQDFFTEKLTWVSLEYAFKLLPHLKPKPKPRQT